jgi:DNA polymerase (family 10)
MTNAEIAGAFERIATLLEIDAANPFRVRAYREAARVIGELGEPLAAKVDEEGGLEELQGIGKDLAQKIRDLVRTGTTGTLEELKKKFPPGLIELTTVQGMGPKRVRAVFTTLGIQSRAELAEAATGGKLRELPGFGEKLEQNIIKSLARAPADTGRLLLAGAWPVAQAIAERLRKVAGVDEVEIAGSFRRRRETVGDLDVLVCGRAAEAVMKTFVGLAEVAEVLGQGETKSSVKLANGLQVDVRVVPRESFGAALLYFTGSKAHNIELRRIAIDKGLTLNEYGLFHGDAEGTRVAGRTEKEVYRALDLDWIPPELREAAGEIEQARAGRLPRLIEPGDLRADLHIHSDRSDGQATLETMVRACRSRGYAYCAITEHSRSLAMTRGFDGERVRKSVLEMAAVRKQVPGIEVLHGLEVDILAEGALDLDDDALALLDWVIVSLHARLDQPRDVMTARVLKALEHPSVCAMGHPSARLIGARPPAELDFERVFERAAALGVAMEINAQPDRLDLSDVNARLARERGARFVIDTDAHSVNQLEHMPYGVFVARRAGLTRDDVLNTLPYERFRAQIRKGGSPPGPRTPKTEAPAKPAGRTAGGKVRAKAPAAKRGPAKPRAAKPGAAKKGRGRP